MTGLLAERLLLVIDPQAAFLTGATQDVFARCAGALEHYRLAIVSQCVNVEGSCFRTLLDWTGCGPDEPDTALDPRFWHLPTLTKSTYAVSALSVQPYLQACQGVDLAGVETDACVLATALHLFDAGIDVRVRADLCAGKLHEEALRILQRQLGQHRVIEPS